MRNVILISLLFMTKLLAASSLSLDSNSFRMLILRSDYIVFGRVEGIHQTKEIDTGISPTGILKVRVVELLHGNFTQDIVDIPFEPDLTAISEPEYPLGGFVLSFLKKNADGSYYSVESTGGGRKLTVVDFQVYKTRVKEIQRITDMTDEYKKFIATIEWLVAGFEHDVSRFETNFEFADFMRHYSRPELSLSKILTEKQKLRLKKILLESTETEPFNFILVDVLYPDYKAEIRPVLLHRLKTAQGHELWFAGEYMRLLSEGKNSEELKKITAEFMDVGFRRSKEKELKGLADKFVLVAEKN